MVDLAETYLLPLSFACNGSEMGKALKILNPIQFASRGKTIGQLRFYMHCPSVKASDCDAGDFEPGFSGRGGSGSSFPGSVPPGSRYDPIGPPGVPVSPLLTAMCADCTRR